MVYIIIKGDRGGYTAPRKNKTISLEEHLMNKVDDGSVTDRDIDTIVKKGDWKMQRHMIERANRLNKDKKHLDRMYGEGVWDGKDNEGNLFKDTQLYDPADPHKDI